MCLMKKILFDQDWRYFSGPYMSFAPFPPQIEESRWTAIDLPHDAINGLPRNAQNPSGMAGGYTQSAMPVSYTHLDVYKRQNPCSVM